MLRQLSFTHATLGLRAARQNDLPNAVAFFTEARSLYNTLGDVSKEAMCYFQLGLLRVSGELAAIEALQEVSAAPRVCSSDRQTWLTTLNEQAIRLYGSIQEESNEAMCLCELASIFAERDPKSSIHRFKLALMLYCSRGDSDKEARTLFTIASLSCSIRDYGTATAYFTQVSIIIGLLSSFPADIRSQGTRDI